MITIHMISIYHQLSGQYYDCQPMSLSMAIVIYNHFSLQRYLHIIDGFPYDRKMELFFLVCFKFCVPFSGRKKGPGISKMENSCKKSNFVFWLEILVDVKIYWKMEGATKEMTTREK